MIFSLLDFVVWCSKSGFDVAADGNVEVNRYRVFRGLFDFDFLGVLYLPFYLPGENDMFICVQCQNQNLIIRFQKPNIHQDPRRRYTANPFMCHVPKRCI